MKTYEVYIKMQGRSPQWVTVNARDQYHMKQTVEAVYGASTTISNYKTV